MRSVTPSPDWPQVWKDSHVYDLCEIYGDDVSNPGYTQAYQTRRDVALDLLRIALPSGGTVLDVAAAQGNFTLKMAEMGYEVTWNDLRADLEGYVRLKHEHGVVHYCSGNVFELDLEGRFDAVLITEIIEHVAHPDDFLKKVAKLVKPGGYVIMTTPNGAYFRNHLPRFSECEDPSIFEHCQFKPNSDGHIFLLHPDEVHKLATDADLITKLFVLYTTPLTAGHLMLRHLFKFLPKSLLVKLELLARKLPMAFKSKIMLQAAALYQKPLH